MKIVPVDFVSSHKQGTLTGVKKADIELILGFEPNGNGDGGYKVKYDWMFTADGVECAVWDWKGSDKFNEWSFYGPVETFRKLFGRELVRHGAFA